MHIHCKCSCRKFQLDFEVSRIEIGRILGDDEDEPYPTYFREIRIETTDGRVLEVICNAEDKSDLTLGRKPLISSPEEGEPPVDWLTPKVHKG